MKRKTLLLLTLMSAFVLAGTCQDPVVLTVIQQPPLQADAGTDVRISEGASVTIGGNPAALQGYGQYTYLWSPADGLNDPTLANPVASPAATTTYLLTVTDVNHCTAVDEMTLTVDASGVESRPDRLQIRCYPNPVTDDLVIEMSGASGDLTIRLINPVGSEMATRTIRITGNTHSERIPFGELPAGIYYLQLVTKKTTLYHSVIKNRQP